MFGIGRAEKAGMRTFLATSLVLWMSNLAGADDLCTTVTRSAPELKPGIPLRIGPSRPTYKALFDECDARNTYLGKPLPSSGGHHVTCEDKNKVAFVYRYHDGTIRFRAKAAVDADGSFVGCKSGWPNQCETWLSFDPGSARKYVDAEATPFVVIPRDYVRGKGKNAITVTSFRKDTGIGKGDLAVALYHGRCSFAVVGDAGPYFRLGELSLRSHMDLGRPQCAVQGQSPCRRLINKNEGDSVTAGVEYIIFPNTRPRPLYSQNVGAVARKLGSARVLKFLADFRRSPGTP
jgi:hypothetical protein